MQMDDHHPEFELDVFRLVYSGARSPQGEAGQNAYVAAADLARLAQLTATGSESHVVDLTLHLGGPRHLIAGDALAQTVSGANGAGQAPQKDSGADIALAVFAQSASGLQRCLDLAFDTLRPGGSLILVQRVALEPPGEAHGLELTDKWACPPLPTVTSIATALLVCGFRKLYFEDQTSRYAEVVQRCTAAWRERAAEIRALSGDGYHADDPFGWGGLEQSLVRRSVIGQSAFVARKPVAGLWATPPVRS